MSNLKQDWHGVLLICIADIAMLTCFTYFENIPHILGKQKFVKGVN